MTVTIITPTWNRWEKLSRCLASVEAQAPPPLEHIVVDNRSTDATKLIVEAYARRVPYPVRYNCEGDDGIYDAMNRGACLARGEALYFLNDDDRLLAPDSLACLDRALVSCQADFAFADVYVVNSTSRKRRGHHQMNELTLAEKSICQQATLYSRAAFQRVGEFDSRLRAAADYDWICRAVFRHQSRPVYLRHPVAEFSLDGLSNAPQHRDAVEAELAAVCRRYLTEADIRRAKKYRRFWHKVPWGKLFVPGHPNVAKVQPYARRVLLGKILPDPLAWFGF